MRITVFTSNQPRHLSLIEALATVADEVFAVQECNTVFPGEMDDFFRQSKVMQDYFGRVRAAEATVFDGPRFGPDNVRQLAIRMGDASRMPLDRFGDALEADAFVVFGASYLRGALCRHLVANRACNIHMGIAPYYRGSSTNFWAMADGRPDLVGATLHLLSDGLDSGPILCHALPRAEAADPFLVGMKAVEAAHQAILKILQDRSLRDIVAVEQDRGRQMRYSRHAEFTDDVAAEYLGRLPSPPEMKRALDARDLDMFIRPFIPPETSP